MTVPSHEVFVTGFDPQGRPIIALGPPVYPGAQVFGHPADNKGGPSPLLDPPDPHSPKEGT